MELKPRFEFRFAGSPEELESKLLAALAGADASCKGGIREGLLELNPSSENPPFWSPQLRARITAEGSHTLIQGRFAPKAETWTLFIAVYAAVIFSTGVGSVIGFSQYSLGHDAWALWSLPLGALLIAAVWLGARLGQSLGADDMQTLAEFVRESLEGPAAS